ncbi:MAG: AfsR/SARP family transcriptional regulator [Actinomycetota bacterium]|nr:AfsR/SARP family transcriptional regulator [Actinomycetota bacterium]
MAALEFHVLGPLEVRLDGEIVPIPAPKQRALLALLLLRLNEPVPQDELIDELWGEEPPATARASLQNQVYGLRKLLGSETLERQSPGYVVHVAAGCLDLERFERLTAEARGAAPRERAAKLREALACWRGAPLADFSSEPFAQHAVARLEEERLAALESRIDADLELGRHADLVGELEALVSRHPLRERLWAQLMLALYRAGRQAEALASYRRAHEIFVGELGVEPGVFLRDLQRAILVQDPMLDDDEQRLTSALERATAVLPRSPRERTDSLYEYGVALLRIGELRRAAATLSAAERMAARIGEHALAERARLYGSYLSVWKDGTSPLEHLSRAERAASFLEERGDEDGLALSLRQQAEMLSLSGRIDGALAVIERALEVAVRAGSVLYEASCRSLTARFAALGRTPVARAHALCEAQLAAPIWCERPPFGVWLALALLLAQAGQLEGARALTGRVAAAAREANNPWELIGAAADRGLAEYSTGNLTEAAHHLRSAYAMLETEGDHLEGPECGGLLACCLARTGDVGEASRLALSARATSIPAAFAPEVLWRRALALVAAHEGRSEEAVRLSDEARARADASDWLTFRGETLEEAATIRELAGDRDGATQALRDALAVYEQKGNVVGAERVRRALPTGGARRGLAVARSGTSPANEQGG